MKNYPNFFIIGAMKCATTSLHEQLVLQPGIFMTDLKEPNFFSDDDQYDKGMDWYTSLFTPKESDILYGEASTHYTKLPTYPKTIERIQQHIPDRALKSKFIYVVRHPIDRLVSHYIHEWTQKKISTSTDINVALHKHPELIEYSKYSMQLQPYFDAFGQDNVLLVFFESLISTPQDELERVCKFLDYPGDVLWHKELKANNVSKERMRKSEWRDLLVEAPLLSVIRKRLVPKSVRDRVKKLWMMSTKPELSDEAIEHLTEIFDQDLGVLGSWLGVDSLCCDNFKQIAKSNSIPNKFIMNTVK